MGPLHQVARWLDRHCTRRNVANRLSHELPRFSGISYLSPFDHLHPFWVSAQGWRHTYSIKYLIQDSMFITLWCKLDERFWAFMIQSAIQVNTLYKITLHLYLSHVFKSRDQNAPPPIFRWGGLTLENFFFGGGTSVRHGDYSRRDTCRHATKTLKFWNW